MCWHTQLPPGCRTKKYPDRNPEYCRGQSPPISGLCCLDPPAPAFVRTVLYLIPVSFPFLSPGKGTPAHGTNFLREILFFNGFHSSEQSALFTDGYKKQNTDHSDLCFVLPLCKKLEITLCKSIFYTKEISNCTRFTKSCTRFSSSSSDKLTMRSTPNFSTQKLAMAEP